MKKKCESMETNCSIQVAKRSILTYLLFLLPRTCKVRLTIQHDVPVNIQFCKIHLKDLPLNNTVVSATAKAEM